ncbi:FRG domain-containing protein [Rhizobium indicum]|uniref:FRG domain-containing protein n=1 Tax=Rhizobium indicum TaxID=2583231 RepID=A0ABX6PD89_9HYPH|nr:FRG domain-containing protein [Rhizobium indicum]QKK16289.1 FRG domain-containing protein [Rhizobium indicum]
MPDIVTHKPGSFSEVMQLVEAFQDAHETSWYRGVGNAEHSLTPTIFRHPKHTKIEKIHEMETALSSVFEQRSPPFVSQAFKSVWERMFYMQHYGIPTRLLDWTESPFIALYFALTSSERTKTGKPKNDAAFWMLDPILWNRGALSDISFNGGILDPNREQVKSYSPEADLDERKNLPIMIYGTHNSPRIVAQRGMFALFGKSVDAMDKSYSDNPFADGTLHKVVIDKDIRDTVAHSLFRKGISDSTIYPDLHGLSLELRRSFGFSQ